MKCICTVFATLLIFISVIAPTAANEAEWMPDANLRTAVRSALSIVDDAALTQQDMQDLTAFSAVNSQIRDITGLEHATALTRLDIRDNTVTDVSPLSALTDLEELRLKGNTLSDMSPLSGLTTLTFLNLRLTGISSVSALSGLTNLEGLRVDDNSLTDVEPLTSLTNLRKLWIAGNVLTNAHLLSSLPNLSTLDIEIPDPPDTTPPDVSISVPSEVQTGAFDVMIRFTEGVSGFEEEDVSLGGTASADITAWNMTDNTVYTATITPTTSGTVILDIPADVATDAAGNSNTAATQQSVTVEMIPNPSTWLPDANLRTAVRSALSIADDVALTQQDMQDLTAFSAVNSQISNITGLEHATALTSLDIRDNTVTDVNPLSALTDLEELRLKGNTLSDISPLSGLTTLTLLNLRLTGISSVSALSGLTNLEHLRVDDNSLTDVEPLTSLTNLRKLWIAGNALTNAHLLSSLPNLTTLDIEIPDPPDTTPPDVSISVPSEVQTGAFDVMITFTEIVSEFEQEDLLLGGTATASITAWNLPTADTVFRGRNTPTRYVFRAIILPTTSGTVTLDIAADVATDAASNSNTAATQQIVTVDVDAPTVSISVPSGIQTDAFDTTITFSESVSNFVQESVSLSGTATASITSWAATPENKVFTATITPTTSGTVILDIPADVATDAAGNKNTAAIQQTITVDVAQQVSDTTAPSSASSLSFRV